MTTEENNAIQLTAGSSRLLKLCIFATGLTGIVAEYMMATLASYLLGNAVLQWALIISTMLFAMGVGSRLSRLVKTRLLETFIATEIVLSLLCGVASVMVYSLSSWIASIGPLIYLLSFSIGLLIGLEIPLATRLNEVFEDLRLNISGVMETDYLGALLGGLIFSFVALPWLGLTYTPTLLGGLNFVIAMLLFKRFYGDLAWAKPLTAAAVSVPVLLVSAAIAAEPVVRWGEQKKYLDRVVYAEQTPHQRIVITKWQDHHWLYLNGNEQFSTYDEERYHEPLVHPAMALAGSQRNVLILGGGDGLAARELLKYPALDKITLVDLDPAITRLALEHPVLLAANENSLADPRVKVINDDARSWLENSAEIFDVIIIDLPDPKSIGLARLYSREFYQSAKRHLSKGGVLITQATSPYFSQPAFLSILNSVRATGMPTVPLHAHVPTLGEWGWVLASNSPQWSDDELRQRLLASNIEQVPTQFLNRDALLAMTLFGKGELEKASEIAVTQSLDLAVYRYYKEGRWDLH